jgi:hypothetical protein
MKNHLLDRWKDDEVIGISCLTKKGGGVIILNHSSFKIGDETKHYCQPICDTTIKSLEKYDDDIWTEVQEFVRCSDEASGYSYIAGEGGMGNEGFILCLDENEEPDWVLFFVNSNPFYQLELNGGVLEAISSHDLKFSINLSSPEKITISHFEWKG